MKTKIAWILMATTLCGCYPNPTEDDYCVVPLVNNKDITKEKSDPFKPQAAF